MAATIFCTALAKRLKLHRSFPIRFKLCTMAVDDKWNFHLNESGSPRRTKAQIEYLTMIQHHSPVTVSFRRNRPSATLHLRLNICGRLPPHVSTFNYFLKDLLICELKPQIGKPFLARYLVSGVIPDLATFSMILQHYCKQHFFRDVLDLVFTQMKPMEVMADNSFYKTLINKVCTHFGPYPALILLRKLNRRIRMPLCYYDALVGQLSKRGMIDHPSMNLVLKNVMTHMQQHRVCPDEKIYNYLLLCRGRVFCLPENSFKAMAIGSLMLAQGIRDGTVSPTTAL